MKCECTLREFVKKYPIFKESFENLLQDPQYIIKFYVDKNGNFYRGFEIGYKDDEWFIDKD